MKGLIEKLETVKLFGWIRGEDHKNYFFHKDDMVGYWDDLLDDYHNKVTMVVEFNPSKTSKGLRARDVRKI